MPFREYWEGPCWLVRAYRDAARIKREITNHEQWRLVLYVYDTLLRVAPMFDLFGKDRKPKPYVEEPYPLSEKQVKERERNKEEEEMKKVKACLETFAVSFNQSFEEGGAGCGS